MFFHMCSLLVLVYLHETRKGSVHGICRRDLDFRHDVACRLANGRSASPFVARTTQRRPFVDHLAAIVNAVAVAAAVFVLLVVAVVVEL